MEMYCGSRGVGGGRYMYDDGDYIIMFLMRGGGRVTKSCISDGVGSINS